MLKKFGLILIALSFLIYIPVFVIPFLDLSLAMKGVWISTCVIIGEIAFWVGGVILGKEFVMKYRQFLNPNQILARLTKKAPDDK